ncbi:MAG TPA: amidase [Solirubrobacteraceae bacterium]|nr:amidase [Solirubrobacteraceae bacterium]
MDAADLAYAGIARQAELVAAGEVGSHELVELCLERIERYDAALNAFRVVFAERARMEARQADARRVAGGERPLLGVPIAVKDDMDVAGELTALGTNAYGEPARADAEIVRRLRAAGAIVLGKTNVPELCAVPWTESATWGATRNPWSLQHSPGGSSGGTAAAVAAGLVGAGLGSDGGGSIRLPSAYCSLFGLKTQRGRVPLAPRSDAWHGLSVNGVLTRSVRDSALLYDVIAQGPPDPGAPELSPVSLLQALGREPDGSARGSTNGHPPARALRVAVASKLPPSPLTRLHPDNEAALQETATLLARLGHEVSLRELDYGPLTPPVQFSGRYLRGLADDAAELAHPERLERRMRALARLGGLLTPAMIAWDRSREAAYARRLNEPLADNDVLLTPVTPGPAPRIGACEGRGWLWTIAASAATVPYAACWNVTGQPACSVAAGFAAGGLPRAVQLIGRPGEEATLVALAAQIEAERPWAQARPPGFG